MWTDGLPMLLFWLLVAILVALLVKRMFSRPTRDS
jgi:hypothetical protein